VPGSLRRLVVLTGLGAVLGLVGGGAAWLLIHLIGIITNLALFGRWGTDIPSLEHYHPTPWLFVAAAAGGLVVAFFAKWAPVIRGHGIPEAMESILVRQSRIAPRVAVAKPLSSAVAIGTGGPFGAEGPIIVTGGSVGSLLGQLLSFTPSERKILLASGAAAGMAATFGAPLAAVVLAIELLLFEFSARALAPLVAASSVAGAMHLLLFGNGPIFRVPLHNFSGLGELPLFVVLGVACGLLAVVICRGLFAVEAGFRRLPIPEFWHPLIGALGFALVGFFVPRALGVGYDVINDALADELAVATLAVILVAKMLAWWLALGSGTSGGTLAPILLMSSCFGALFAAGAQEVVPGLSVSVSAVAVVAMAATFGAATRASFTAVVFAFELTRDYRAIVPLMLATVVADLVARHLLTHDLMTEKLARRGVAVPRGYEPDYLRSATVRDVMTSAVETVDADETVDDVRERFFGGRHSAYPLVEDRRLVGIVGQTDVMDPDLDGRSPVTDVAEHSVVTASSHESVLDVLRRVLEERVDHIPVVDDGELVGIVTRTDILRARAEHLRADEHDGHRLRFRLRRSA
jgi:H+/Cl- antiporter ClcA/predicted transcriptional regulator